MARTSHMYEQAQRDAPSLDGKAQENKHSSPARKTRRRAAIGPILHTRTQQDNRASLRSLPPRGKEYVKSCFFSRLHSSFAGLRDDAAVSSRRPATQLWKREQATRKCIPHHGEKQQRRQAARQNASAQTSNRRQPRIVPAEKKKRRRKKTQCRYSIRQQVRYTTPPTQLQREEVAKTKKSTIYLLSQQISKHSIVLGGLHAARYGTSGTQHTNDIIG